MNLLKNAAIVDKDKLLEMFPTATQYIKNKNVNIDAKKKEQKQRKTNARYCEGELCSMHVFLQLVR